MRAQDGNFPQL